MYNFIYIGYIIKEKIDILSDGMVYSPWESLQSEKIFILWGLGIKNIDLYQT